MPRYYCDYCDIFLTHDSLAVRKAHKIGWKHRMHVQNYYSGLSKDVLEDVLAKIAKAYKSDTTTNAGPSSVAPSPTIPLSSSSPFSVRPPPPIAGPPSLPIPPPAPSAALSKLQPPSLSSSSTFAPTSGALPPPLSLPRPPPRPIGSFPPPPPTFSHLDVKRQHEGSDASSKRIKHG